MPTPAELHKAERLLNALGDPTRRAIIRDICRKGSSVSQLAKSLDITLTAVGQHVQVLERSDLLHTHKVGRVRVCQFNPKGLRPLEGWIEYHRSLWEDRLDALGELLDEDDA